MIPQKLGRYEIIEELGKGAMGLVYLARDPLIGRQLALKTFRLGFSAQDAEMSQFKARFLREAQSAGILTHTNIVTIHDVVVDEGEDFFIAMEYVKGTDLKNLMQRQGRLDLRFVVSIIAQIADGLDYAHSKGVVHRDIKPANIIITADKRAKITDFGIARVDASNLTHEGQLLGTPNYMAPEQIQGRDVDHRADLFALGVMLYEMVTGKKPFHGENLTVVTHRIVNEIHTSPTEIIDGLPPQLLEVVNRALQKAPEGRYQRGADFAADLRAVFAPTTPKRPQEATTASFLSDVPAQPATAAAGFSTPPAGTQPAARSPYPLSGNTGAGNSVSGDSAGGVRPGTLAGVNPETLAGGTIVQSPTAAQAPPPATKNRNALALGGALLLAALVAVVGLLAIRGNSAPEEQPDPMAQARSQYEPLVQKGNQAMTDGEPGRAIEFFDQALVFVPGDKEIRKLREQAERMLLDGDTTLEEAMIRDRIARAESALARRDYRQAIELAGGILEVDPENDRGKELLTNATEGQRRRDQEQGRVRDRLRNPRVSPAAPAAVPAIQETPAPSTAVAEPANLEIDFFSQISEGIVMVYTGGDKFYQENFKFVGERKGLLRRAKKTSGRLSHSGTVTSGDVKLRVYVRRQGETKSVELQGNFPPGDTRVLRIRVEDDGSVQVRLE